MRYGIEFPRLSTIALMAVTLASLAAPTTSAFAQEEELPPPTEAERQALRVFLDCGACDFDYVRRTIRFADWMRDRQDAQVHVLVTVEVTGAGGAEYTLNFIGGEGFEGVRDVVGYTTRNTDTQQEVREGLTHTLHLGLVQFVAGTPLGSQIRIVFEPAEAEAFVPTEPEDDPWDSWVFSFGADGSFSGQETTNSTSVAGGFTANRTTEDWKIRFSMRGSYARDFFELSEEDFTSIFRRYTGSGLLVRSISDHWSVGFRGTGGTSTFANLDLSMRLAPAIEYSIFPYAESSTRELRFLYSMGVNNFNYTEETIFGVTQETLPDLNLAVVLDLVQPWGSAEVGIEGSAYLTDLSENRISLFASSDWRIYRGLSLTLIGNVARISDQRNLSAEGVSDEDILLRRRELLTSFSYFLSVGFSYTFGSKFANVVNPRFGI